LCAGGNDRNSYSHSHSNCRPQISQIQGIEERRRRRGCVPAGTAATATATATAVHRFHRFKGFNYKDSRLGGVQQLRPQPRQPQQISRCARNDKVCHPERMRGVCGSLAHSTGKIWPFESVSSARPEPVEGCNLWKAVQQLRSSHRHSADGPVAVRICVICPP
jgi:hypothetical protein